MNFIVYIACLFALCSIVSMQNVFQFEIDRLKDVFEKHEDNSGSLKLKSYSWKDCGSANALVAIKALSITPDPLSFPGALNVATQFTVKKAVGRPLTGNLKVYKKELGVYIEIPCIDQFGSCSYNNLCSVLDNIKSQCPDPLKKIGIDCGCPIKAGSYSLPKTEFDISASVIPSGEYHVIANVTTTTGEAGCLDLFLEVA